MAENPDVSGIDWVARARKVIEREAKGVLSLVEQLDERLLDVVEVELA